jgi:hypothetical protein
MAFDRGSGTWASQRLSPFSMAANLWQHARKKTPRHFARRNCASRFAMLAHGAPGALDEVHGRRVRGLVVCSFTS